MAKEKFERMKLHLNLTSGMVIFNNLDIESAKVKVAALHNAEHFATRIMSKEMRKPLRVSNVASESAAHIYIDDEISKYYGVGAADIVQAFTDIGNKDVILHINCAGGDVMQARQICATIAAHKGNVTAQIEGLCASAATFITCACDEVTMNVGGLFMIHNASSICWGDSKAMTKKAEILHTITDTIADDYVAKTGADKKHILKMMDDETYFTAQEAFDAGFIDQVIELKKDDEAATNKANILIEAKAPEAAPPDEPVAQKPDLSLVAAQYAAKARVHELSEFA